GTAIKSELFKPEVANRRANSAVRAPRAREARGTTLRRAELGCGRQPALEDLRPMTKSHADNRDNIINGSERIRDEKRASEKASEDEKRTSILLLTK
ncbi:MAG: hypothetical protein FWH55_07380, partial [Oscillospiraceae bacterium]|nr:hypothetical protein [Oscillospiraceae bacterium]